MAPSRRRTRRRGRGKKQSISRGAKKSSAAEQNQQSVPSASSDVGDPINNSNTFIFLSDTDSDTQNSQIRPSDGFDKSNSDGIQFISQSVPTGTTTTANSSRGRKNRGGRLARNRGGCVSGLQQNSTTNNLQLGSANNTLVNSLNTSNRLSVIVPNVNNQQSNSAATSLAFPPRRRGGRRISSQVVQVTYTSSDSENDFLMGMTLYERYNKESESPSQGKGSTVPNESNKNGKGCTPKEVKLNCNDSDSWSDSSDDDQAKNIDTPKSKEQQDVTAEAAVNVQRKLQVETDWSEEDLENDEFLQEAAIFSNRIENFKQQMKEFQKKEWADRKSLVKELIENEELFKKSPPKKKKVKRKVNKNSSTASDDSDSAIAAKIPVVIAHHSSGSDEDKCAVKIDEPVTEEHISKTVRNRIERKIKRMQEEHKEILSIPVGYACSDDEDLQCLSDKEVHPEIIIKVRWQHELLKIPMRLNETFAKVFNELAKKSSIEASNIMLLLRDKTVSMSDTPKLLTVTTGDILDSCIWNVHNDASNAASKTNLIRITMQSNDSKVRVPCTIHKTEPMSSAMEEYSTKRGIPLEKMIFKFDGEKIDPNSTPVDLDIEDESCIDVKIL